MPISKTRKEDAEDFKEFEELRNMDSVSARYTLRYIRTHKGDEAVVRSITARGPNNVTQLFWASKGNVEVLLDELETSGGRDAVASFIKATDDDGNTVLHKSEYETAEAIIARLHRISTAADVWDFINHKNKDGDLTKLKELIEKSTTATMRMIRSSFTPRMQD